MHRNAMVEALIWTEFARYVWIKAKERIVELNTLIHQTAIVFVLFSGV
jgi:hypothetical protein